MTESFTQRLDKWYQAGQDALTQPFYRIETIREMFFADFTEAEKDTDGYRAVNNDLSQVMGVVRTGFAQHPYRWPKVKDQLEGR